MELQGKVAIITGAARGIGKGIALAYVKAGADVLIIDREEVLGKETDAELREINPKAAFLAMDVTRHDELETVVENVVARFGRLDILVNAAQSSRVERVADTSNEAMAIAFDTGFWPSFILMRAAYPHLKATRGCVINFGSGAAFGALPTQGSYSAAKEAIRSISKTAANEWGAEGVRVNIICPFANSPGVQHYASFAPDEYAALLEKVPLKRIGDCEKDIGAAAVFLASDKASFITGHTLMVDGYQSKGF